MKTTKFLLIFLCLIMSISGSYATQTKEGKTYGDLPIGKNSGASSPDLHMMEFDYVNVSPFAVLNPYSLYMVGSAVTGVGWDYTKAQEMDDPGANQVSWEGYLEKGEFKLLYSRKGGTTCRMVSVGESRRSSR